MNSITVKFLLAFCIAIFCNVVYASNSSPPIAVFGLNESLTLTGLPCNNNKIPNRGVLKFEDDSGAFDESGKTFHGSSVNVYCDEDNAYYDNLLFGSYQMKCLNGRWVNESNNVCVKKCEFGKDEFNDENVPKQGGLLGNEDGEFEISDFSLAEGMGVTYKNSKYYANIGTEVTVTCPQGFPPYTSDLSRLKDELFETNTFKTSCLDTSRNGNNQWSTYFVCFNGTKPCDNDEISIDIGGESVATYDGIQYREKGGVKKAGTGKYTPHGGFYPIDCSPDWYQDYNVVKPRCDNGNWDFKKAYCIAKQTTVQEVYTMADEKGENRVAKDINLAQYISDSPSKKIFWGQRFEFSCKHSNRYGEGKGKAFMINFTSDDVFKIDRDYDVENWYGRYCVSENACKPELGMSLTQFFFPAYLLFNKVPSLYYPDDDNDDGEVDFQLATYFVNTNMTNLFDEGESVYTLHSQYHDWWGGLNRWQRCDRMVYEFTCINKKFVRSLYKGGNSYVGEDDGDYDSDQESAGRVHKSRGHSYEASNSAWDHYGMVDYVNCVGYNTDYIVPYLLVTLLPVEVELHDQGKIGNKDKNANGYGDGYYRYSEGRFSGITVGVIGCEKENGCIISGVNTTKNLMNFNPHEGHGISSRTYCYRHGVAVRPEDTDDCDEDSVRSQTVSSYYYADGTPK